MKSIIRTLMASTIVICMMMIFTGCASEHAMLKTGGDNSANAGKAPVESGYEEENYDFSGDGAKKSGKWSDSKVSDESQDAAVINGDSSFKKESFYQTGVASWYGREFNGKKTASGEKFDMNGMTAAHKTLPFGTILKVKNFDNNKTVTVRINDRGPYRGKRIIDLSYGAAKKLGMVSIGEAQVGIKIIKKMSGSADSDKDPNEGEVEAVSDSTGDESSGDQAGLTVQAGAFYSKRNADNLKSRIEGMTNNSVVVLHEGDMYKVRINGLSSRRDAERVKKALSEDNIPSFLINHDE